MNARLELIDQLKQVPLSYWAVVENYRWWLAHDQVYAQLIAVETNGITAETVRTIAKAYGINRNIETSDDKQDDKTAKAIAQVLNTSPFSEFALIDTAEGKLELFREILGRMPMNATSDRSPTFVSGTSKLIWFFAPRYWTMFDRLAADGAKIPKGKSSIERAERYFCALTERGFENIVDVARPLFESSPFAKISPERLVDKYLWLAGCTAEAQDNARLSLHFYVRGLPSETCDQLEHLARQVSDACEVKLLGLTAKR